MNILTVIMGGTFLVEQPGSSLMEEFCRFKAMCDRLRVPWTKFDGGCYIYICTYTALYRYIYIYILHIYNLYMDLPLNCVWGFNHRSNYINIFDLLGIPSGKLEMVLRLHAGIYRDQNTMWLIDGYKRAPSSCAQHRFTNALGGWPTILPSARRGRRHLATQNIFKSCVGESSQLPSGQNAP